MSDTFRKQYAPLTELQKAEVLHIKELADALLSFLDQSVLPTERSERSRCMAIARTNLEQTVMWAVKAVTTPDSEVYAPGYKKE